MAGIREGDGPWRAMTDAESREMLREFARMADDMGRTLREWESDIERGKYGG